VAIPQPSFSAAFFALVALFAYLYLSADGMYGPLALRSGEYLLTAVSALTSREPGQPEFVLDLAQPRHSPTEYGAGPVLTDVGGRYLTITAPVLRLNVPRLAAGTDYEVSLAVSARLARPDRLSLLLGDSLRGEFALKGDGRPEKISWVVPGKALSAGAQAFILATSWGPYARVAPDSDQAIWLNLYSLRISPQSTSH
jgi:hypothetical protein